MPRTSTESVLDALPKLLARNAFTPAGPVNDRGAVPVSDRHGRPMTVRIAFGPVPKSQRTRNFVNTTSGNHVIQVSDRLDPRDWEEALDAAFGDIADAYAQPHAGPDFDDLRRRMAIAERDRTRASARTLSALRARVRKAPLPAMRLMIGGGATLVGRSESITVVDSCGRWHLHASEGLTQSADQVRLLAETGAWSPRAHVPGDRRMPTVLLQTWEDTAAVRGPVIDGTVALSVDGHDRLLAEITPADGSGPVVVELLDHSVVSTGLLPEMVPGARPDVPDPATAVRALRRLLERDGTPSAKARFEDRFAGANGAEEVAVLVRDTLREHGMSERDDALVSMAAFITWHRARRAAPGRVLSGDEVSDRRFDASVSDDWIVLGFGGAATANAEIILNRNPRAKVRIIGLRPPLVLHNELQFPLLLRRHEAGHGGDGRLRLIGDCRIAGLEVARDADGGLRFGAHGQFAPAVVSCLGRPKRTPHVLDPVIEWAESNHGAVRAAAGFDEHDQYLGYRLVAEARGIRRTFEVCGSASRLAPTPLFSSDDAARIEFARWWDAPPESGNDATGFLVSALQGHRRRAAGEHR